MIVNIFTNQAIPKTSYFALTQTACFFVYFLEIAIKCEEHLFSTFPELPKKIKKKVSNVSTQLFKVAPTIYN